MTRTNVNAWIPRLLIAVASLMCLGAFAQVPPPSEDGDPPMRVGRLAYFDGAVSYSPAGDDQWVLAPLNRPVVTGDRLWSDVDGRAELSTDNGSWFLGPRTSVTVSNLDDRTTQLQVQQGVLDVRLRRLPAGNIVEIDTPNVAFSLTRPGRYRIDVDPDGGSTVVIVRSGMGTVYGDETSYVVTTGQAYRFYGTDLSDNEFLALPPYDSFDSWSAARERRYATAVSARYVSPEVVGYADLDSYGRWSVVAGYGNVWFPSGLAVGWAPYRYGHWAWIDPWGWTWIDDAPWGFAPFHYGRWVHADRGWGWVPGPVHVRPYYAPALVAFVGGAGFSISISSGPSIGWFPLGPREVYRPPYHVSHDYFQQVNVTNTVINNTYVTNIYNNPSAAPVSYANMRAPNAVTAVPTAAFATSEQVHRVAVPLAPAALASAQVQAVPRIAPARSAFLGAAPLARTKPPAAVEQRPVVARVAPPPPPVPVARQLPALEKNPGQPMNRAEIRTLRAEAPVAAPPVRIVGQGAKPAPTASPPAHRGGVPPTAVGPAASQRAQPPVQQRAQPQVQERMQSQGQQRAQPPQPQVRERAQPQVQQRTQPQVQERVQPQVRERAQPQGQERVQPQGQQRAQPPQPQVRERAQPQVQQRTQPQVQERVQPQVQQRTQPQVQERMQPQGQPRAQPPQPQVRERAQPQGQQRAPEHPAPARPQGSAPGAPNAHPAPEPGRQKPKDEANKDKEHP
ncbi:MAG: DUF6600 domain-containing protein [Candidatus Levyibacteriota bacterium]